jgi:hypothetical protein
MSQRTALAALAGGVTLFVLGYVCYVLLLGDFFAGQGAAGLAQPILWAIFLGELALAVLVTYVFNQWATISTFAGGFKAGAVLGALLGLNYGLVQFGAMGAITLTGAAVDTVVTLVRVGIAGGVIGLVLGRK